jgi:hypothetical protein
MEIDEAEFDSLVAKHGDKKMVEYTKEELNSFVDETERANAYMSNHCCLPKAQFSKCLFIRNSLISMHHEVAEPEYREKNLDYKSVQAHWKTGEVTVIDDNYSSDQCLYHLAGCFLFKSRKSMLEHLVDRYLQVYESDGEGEDENFGFVNNYEKTLEELKEGNEKEVERKLIEAEKFDKNKLSVLGKRCYDQMQKEEKNRNLTIKVYNDNGEMLDDSSSDCDASSESESDSESSSTSSNSLKLRPSDPELKYDEMEFGNAVEDLINDFMRWCIFGYTPMKSEDWLDEFPANCSRIELDFEAKRVLFAWCFNYDQDVGAAILQKSETLSMYLNSQIGMRSCIDKWQHFDQFEKEQETIELIKQWIPEFDEKNLTPELVSALKFKPFFELYLKKRVKVENVAKRLKLQDRHDITGREYSVIYDPNDDKLYFYDPKTKQLNKEWVMELSFKQCTKINQRMLDLWIAEDKKIEEMKNADFNDNVNKKLKIK